MTKERLDNLLIFDYQPHASVPCATREEALELIRLAKLGLWAEEKAIPALKDCEDISCPAGCSGYEAAAALKELPDAAR